MTNQHRALPEVWAAAEKWGANERDGINCVLELRSRIEALEAAQQKIRSAPESPLVETVARLIANFASTGLPGDDATPAARVAILEVAAWIRSELNGRNVADRLEQEANRG